MNAYVTTSNQSGCNARATFHIDNNPNRTNVEISLDGGKTWSSMGLEQTRHIHRVIIDPTNPDVVYVGAIGSPWGEHPERGVFKTEDGGKTWSKILFANNKTGVADMVMDPENPNKLLVAMWEHKREPWFFNSGGEGSGLHITHDGGKTWKKITDKDGLPKGDLGRIGVAIATNKPNIVYALVEAKKNGFYKSDEKNSSAYPNLGLARANSVKNYLVLHGVPSKQIDTYGQLNDDIHPDDKATLFGPLKFGMLTLDTADTSAMEALEKACQSVRENPLVLHFKTGQAAIALTNEQRQKIADISHCVDKLGVKVQVVGHTDNTGDAANNVILGQQRADFAKGYLIKNGILGGNIETSSKGQAEPIADNATDEGKAQNRRTVITIN